MSFFTGIGLKIIDEHEDVKRRARWWQALAIAVIVVALGGPTVVQAVSGTDFTGINILKNGEDVQQGGIQVDNLTATPVGGATTGNVNIMGQYLVNGATITPGAQPTLFPTCASGAPITGTGSQGAQCGSTITPQPTFAYTAPTVFPTCAAGVMVAGTGAQGLQCGPTLTPQPTFAYTAPTVFPTCASGIMLAGTGVQGIQCGPTITPIPTFAYVAPTAIPTCASGNLYGGPGYSCATPVSGGLSSLTLIGTTFAAGDTTMTLASTWYTGVTLASALTNGKTYLLSCDMSLASDASSSAPANGTIELFDSTNSVEIATKSFINANTGTGNTYGATLADKKYSGFAGTPTIICRARATTELVIKATAAHGAANLATSITGVQTN